jgi:hypothetical protein
MKNGKQPIAPMPYTNSDGSIQHDVYSGITTYTIFTFCLAMPLESNFNFMKLI